jgi:hypothetical protein
MPPRAISDSTRYGPNCQLTVFLHQGAGTPSPVRREVTGRYPVGEPKSLRRRKWS